MDQQQQQIPTLKGETVKRKEDKKKGGLLANLLGKLGTGGGGASAGAGAGSAGFGGAVVSGGLLATKAGIVSLIVAGTTVAGGLGLVGYKIFGGSGASGAGGFSDSFNSLFASHPKQAPAAQEGEKNAAKGDGSSTSLQYFADANKGAPAPEEKKPDAAAAPGADANKDAPANSASSAIAAAKAMANNNAPSSGPAAKLGGVGMKMGQLSQNTGSGSSGASFSMGAGAKGNDLLASAAQLGKTKGMTGGGLASGSTNKGIASVSRRGKAFSQLGSVLRDNRGANSSGAAGRTYDGGAAQSGSFGTTQGSGIEGMGAGAKDKAPTSPSNTPMNDLNHPNLSVPPVQGQPVTPWQKEMDMGKYGLMGFMGLALLASMAAKKATEHLTEAATAVKTAQGAINGAIPPNCATGFATAATSLADASKAMHEAQAMLGWAIAGFVAAGGAAALAMAMGGQIMGGEFNQHTAGLALLLGGGGALAASALAILSCQKTMAEITTATVGVDAAAKSVQSMQEAAAAADSLYLSVTVPPGGGQAMANLNAAALRAAANGTAAPAGAQVHMDMGTSTMNNIKLSKDIDPLSFGAQPLMYITGGAAVVALGYNMLFLKPNKVDPSKCPKDGCPSYHYHAPTPSEEVLKEYFT